MHAIPIYVGFDPREAACYHVWCQSVIARASLPVAFIPLHGPMLQNFDGQKDGSNAFIYSRFLVPYLSGYDGFAIFVDGDMACLEDIAKLWELCDPTKAVQVVKHDYKTKHPRKYIGTPMESDNVDYPGKNRSSVILWNCAHPRNRILTRELVSEAGGQFLHRFAWLADSEIGELPPQWNALALEQDVSMASLIHYTLGAPGFAHYAKCDAADHWHRAKKAAMYMAGD
jgi:lipopolysaccharide biosynthesis glycosyltransferase